MASKQEGTREDVERAFGVLQVRWHILRRPSRFWTLHTMHKVVKCCVILHYMMVEYWDMDAGREEDVEDSSATIGGEDGGLMWQLETNLSESSLVPGTIAAACAFSSFTKDEEEYYLTRELVMNHL